MGNPSTIWALSGFQLYGVYCSCKVNPKKLETGLRPNSAGIPHTLLSRIEAIGFPTFGLLLWVSGFRVEGLDEARGGPNPTPPTLNPLLKLNSRHPKP